MTTKTMNLPGVGEVKKSYVAIGAAVTAGILAVAYYRHAKANQAAAASASTTNTSGYDPNAIDPSTGMTYAEEASGDLGSFGYGGVSDYGGSYYGNGNIVGYDQYGNPIYSTGITGNQVYSTNSDWATAAESILAANGVDTATAAQAISQVLAGLPVTSAQQDLFMEAVGQLGQPPQGYPTPIKLTTTPDGNGTGSGTGTGTGSMVTVPNCIGLSAGEAHNLIQQANLKPTAPAGQTATMKVSRTAPSGGTQVPVGSSVAIFTSGWVTTAKTSKK